MPRTKKPNPTLIMKERNEGKGMNRRPRTKLGEP